MDKINNLEKFNNLRSEYKEFIYKDYIINELDNKYEIVFIYSLDNKIEFNNKIYINKIQKGFMVDIYSDISKMCIFNIGIAEAISYYKTTCSKVFNVECGYLDDYQTKWWQKLIYNGLGELRYLNGFEHIEIDDFISIISNKELKGSFNNIDFNKYEYNGNLIPIGGGKDSIVTLELLKQYENTPFMFYHKRQASYDTCKVAGFDEKDTFEVDRNLDTKLFELNEKGYINGHVPISSMIAFVSFLSAILLGKEYIVLSNESSSNEGNIEGTNINHQYSKSFEFEQDFNDYTSKYFTDKIKYFSLLRPISEYQITKQLVKYDKYLNIFRSCNAGIKQNIWCGKCPKCVFVYILLSPFLQKDKLNEIFNKNMLEDIQLELEFRKLIGLEIEKPFECVGTKDEIIYALKKYISSNDIKALPILVSKYYDYIQNYVVNENYDTYFNNENLVPDIYLEVLKKKYTMHR